MFTLGIDPGLSRCGFGLICENSPNESPEVISAGILLTDPKNNLPSRLAEMMAQINDLIATNRPDCVVVERVLFQVNAKTAMSVGQVSGLVLATAGSFGIDVFQYSSNEIKQAIAGYGSATKLQIKKMVEKLLKLNSLEAPADVTDALALALCHTRVRKYLHVLSEAQK